MPVQVLGYVVEVGQIDHDLDYVRHWTAYALNRCLDFFEAIRDLGFGVPPMPSSITQEDRIHNFNVSPDQWFLFSHLDYEIPSSPDQ